MFSSHLRNHAKTARMIASFGNLYISGVRWRKPEPGCVIIGDVSWARSNEVVAGIGDASRADVALGSAGVTDPGYNLFNDRSQLTDLIQANKCVHFGQRFAQLAPEPLRQAAAYD